MNNLSIRRVLIISIAFFTSLTACRVSAADLLSPDKSIRVRVFVEGGRIMYTVLKDNDTVIAKSRLGLVRSDGDFFEGMSMAGEDRTTKVTDDYLLMFGKSRTVSYEANERRFRFKNRDGRLMHIVWRVSNDGVAFRYHFPGKKGAVLRLLEERTSYRFPQGATGWLQPMQEAKTGWEKTNPAYEEHYRQSVPVGTPAPTNAGWVYPALFQSGRHWVVVSEASVDSFDCATRLRAQSSGGEYSIGYPDPREVVKGGGLLPEFTLPYNSPWRILALGSLATIAESTLGTDLAQPSRVGNSSFIRPGKSSWSWINSKDDFITYDEQIRYIDFASHMRWQYCLVDAAWDSKIGYDSIRLLADYAKKKNVGLLLWYNSAGDWNTVTYTPKDRMLTHESRTKEFALLKEIGIRGVKIDFFGGDGQSVMRYYLNILKDAADYGLMVNFHGATLPRGWHRTYPNLLTAEAVRGFEMITFNQGDADKEATHCTILPFTRNVFDPMDFTPMNLYKIQTRVQRKTSSAFELALSVLFLSGIQHFAESPEGMETVPEFVKEFLRNLPDTWDEMKFIEGYPGKYVVIARRSGSTWYVAGINAETGPREIKFDSSIFGKQATVIREGKGPLTFQQDSTPAQASSIIRMPPSGGFVMTIR